MSVMYTMYGTQYSIITVKCFLKLKTPMNLTHLLYEEIPSFDIRQHFNKTLLLFMHNNNAVIFNQINHPYRTSNMNNVGFVMPILENK